MMEKGQGVSASTFQARCIPNLCLVFTNFTNFNLAMDTSPCKCVQAHPLQDVHCHFGNAHTSHLMNRCHSQHVMAMVQFLFSPRPSTHLTQVMTMSIDVHMTTTRYMVLLDSGGIQVQLYLVLFGYGVYS